MNEYFLNLNKVPKNDLTQEIKEYAQVNRVPIILDEGLLYLLQIIRLKNVLRILEIGTAIGYSSIQMALINKDIKIDTIERNEELVMIAEANIKKANLSKQINVYHDDALTINLNSLRKKYDLIFIDAAKAQYIKLFERFSPLLKAGSLIVSDNLLFHGLVNNEDLIENKNLKMLVRKINNYNIWLANNEAFLTTFFPIGDGIAVSEKL